MTNENVGDQLYQIVYLARGFLFEQGELAQLTYGAFDIAARNLQEHAEDQIELKYPVGYLPDRTPIEGTKNIKRRS
jgi:hypothetical protein